jgi:DMSO/TMAO reductase YedYZ heme-binding membrane subunit
VSRPGTIQDYADYPYEDDYEDDFDDGYAPAKPKSRRERRELGGDPDKGVKRSSIDSWMDKELAFFPGVKRKKIALILIGALAFVPIIFTLRGWLSLNEKNSLTNTEADSLGTGGELTFLFCVSITPLITVTGARWFAPLRRWWGIMFVVIGTSDSITASITGDFAGGPIGRVSGHSFLLAGLFIILLGLVVVATSNTAMQRMLGRYWKTVQKVTYVIWAMIVIHLALLDGLHPFDGPQGDGDPVFHQRLYQILAISAPLVLLRLPPIKRWVIEQRENGQKWKVWVAFMPLFTLYVLAMLFVLNEEINTGMKILTMHPPGN